MKSVASATFFSRSPVVICMRLPSTLERPMPHVKPVGLRM